MAKKSKIEANARRRATVARYAERRAELVALINHPATSQTDRAAAQREPAAQPRDASATRVRNRDAVDGRPRGAPARVRSVAGCGCASTRTRATCPA